MRDIGFMLAVFGGILLGGCAQQQASGDLDRRVAMLLQDFRGRPDGPMQDAGEIERMMRARGMSVPPSAEEWEKMLSLSLEGDFNARFVLMAGAREWGKYYIMSMYRSYGEATDIFTQYGLLSTMEDVPQDEQTAQYVLELALRTWDLRWPEGIDLHGNQPRDEMVYFELFRIWKEPTFPEETPSDVHQELLKKWIADTLSKRSAWEFDRQVGKWCINFLKVP